MLLFKALCYSKTPPRNEGAAAKKHEIRLRTGGWVSGSGFGPRNLHSRIIVVFFEAPEVTMTRVIPMATAGLPDKSVETGGVACHGHDSSLPIAEGPEGSCHACRLATKV